MIAHIKDAMEIEEAVLIMQWHMQLKKSWKSYLCIRKKEGKVPGEILLLGRYAFDGDRLERSGLFEYVNRGNKIKSVKYPYLNITFMTVHSSKGLGYDDVIL